MHSEDEIIEGYLKHAEGDESCFWAFVEMIEILEEDTARAWRMTCEMAKRATGEEALEAIAAGPLEDILSFHGEEYIDRVEAFARKNHNFREALKLVMLEEEVDAAIVKRVRKACG